MRCHLLRPLAPLVILLAAMMCLVAKAQSPEVGSAPAGFEAEIENAISARFGGTAKQWRQIAPSVYHLAQDHAEAVAKFDGDGRTTTLGALAEFIEAKRKAVALAPVLAPGRKVIGLLDPDRGLEPKEITAIADAYGCDSTIYKKASGGDQDGAEQTLDAVAAQFLAAITDAVATSSPTTIIVLGHGLPTEIQSYHIRFERLAKAMLDGVPSDRDIDLCQVVLVCDDCFSADFSINLLGEIAREAGRRDRQVKALPVCIAGTNRNRVGFVSINEKFVPHFWRDVIELYFIRQPRPKAVTLANFFENVDHMMYGYGRAPIFEDGHVTGYRLIDAELVQDPVVFVPLDEADQARLRTILKLPTDAPVAQWLDIG